MADILLIATIAGLDGGSHSPYMLLLILPFLFAAMSYPPRTIAAVGIADLVAFFGVAFGVGGGLPLAGFGLFAGACIALLGAWEARNQSRQRAELTETAAARLLSEETSRRQAHQQREVARFGLLAIEGAHIDELAREASRILTGVLEIDFGGVLKLLPGEDELLLVAAEGLPKEMIGEARVPADLRSQSGYALAAGKSVVVEDWREETRFQQSDLQRSQGMQSAAIILIKGHGRPYGVIGAGSRVPHRFSQEDVSFMQAIANVLANAIDRRAAEQRTQHEALHDPLTGLPNRNLFLDRLEHALSVAQRRGTPVSVLFLDLDQFKLVNDSLGHAAGDELLAAVAPRIEEALRPGDTVARFGGDEFAILAEDIGSEHGATRIAERVAEALARPFVLRGREHFVSASVGIAIGAGTEKPESLIRDADSALYRAKEHGRGGYEIFDEVMRSRVIEHMQVENDLQRAIQREELELHYQPVIRLRDGSIVAMEALLRWNHPDRGLVGPLAFIPVAEETRLIVPIGRWVIEQACRQAAIWQQLSPDAAPVSVAVNLSGRQLADPPASLPPRGFHPGKRDRSLQSLGGAQGGHALRRDDLRGADPRFALRAGRAHGPRRLRRRLLLPRLPEASPPLHDQARSDLRREPHRGLPRRRDRPRSQRDGGHDGNRRGRRGGRDRGAGSGGGCTRLRVRPGLPLLRAGPGGPRRAGARAMPVHDRRRVPSRDLSPYGRAAGCVKHAAPRSCSAEHQNPGE